MQAAKRPEITIMSYSNAPASAVDAEPAQHFADFSLPPLIKENITALGLDTPTPIQSLAIPPLLAGRDIMGLAQTGTGKTAAFLLPLLTHLGNRPPVKRGQPPSALILTPTRELAQQILENVRKLAVHTRLRALAVYGGARYDGQINGLRRGADIVVATPGRLEDLIARGAVALSDISHFILDEADHMLDLGFHPAITRIAAQIPPARQTMLFSATMPAAIRTLAASFMQDPVYVEAPRSTEAISAVRQQIILVTEPRKKELLAELLAKDDVTSAVIFVRTRRRADTLSSYMAALGFQIDALHGDMKQALRRKVLGKFRNGQISALIATDVAARGIDIPRISHVYNFDLPDNAEPYIHRIGRTGRAGKSGTAISLCSDQDKKSLPAIIAASPAKISFFTADGTELDEAEVTGRPQRNQPRRRSFKNSRPAGKLAHSRSADTAKKFRNKKKHSAFEGTEKPAKGKNPATHKAKHSPQDAGTRQGRTEKRRPANARKRPGRHPRKG